MNNLQLYRHTDPSAERGYKTVYVGPDHPGHAALHPIPGIGLGYNDQKIIDARELICAVAEGRPSRTSPWATRSRSDGRGPEIGQRAPLGQARRDLSRRNPGLGARPRLSTLTLSPKRRMWQHAATSKEQ
jgi:hypothetical protein